MNESTPYETEIMRRNRERRNAIVAEFNQIMTQYPSSSRMAVYTELARKHGVSAATVQRYVIGSKMPTNKLDQ